MEYIKVELSHKTGDGYIIPMGSFNLVAIKTDLGMIGCGAFDVDALDRFNYPSARIANVTTIDDLRDGEIKEANQSAIQRGVTSGMSGREALNLL
ncbi:MAG: DUF1805 domain-containing protein [Kiritimatiellae bacterium]|nr:DUF1805 domain-containing protein [Kiritimatiellia bacterium]